MRWVGTLIVVIYLGIGAFVANDHGYFKNIDDLQNVLSAVLAVVAWPLVLFDVDLRFGDDAKGKKGRKDGPKGGGKKGGGNGKGILVPLALWELRRRAGALLRRRTEPSA